MNVRTSSWSFPLALASTLILAVACGGDAPNGDATPSDENGGREETAPVVETVSLVTTGFIEYIDLSGVTEPIRSATLAAEVGGRITQYNLEVGQQVKSGDVLVRVDASQASAQASQLQAQIDQLDLDIARNERLLERGLSSQQQLDQLRSQREASYQSMRSVRIGVGNARTRAPFDGTVLEESSELGEFASPGAPIARIGDLSTIKVNVGLPERELTYVKEGALAEVVIPALNQSFEGTVTRMGVETDRRNRTFPVEIQVDNKDGLLRSGMRAEVLLRKAVIEDAIVVPRDVLRQGMGTLEAVLVRDGRVEVRPVTVGTGHGRYIVALSGLNTGEELVIRGQRDLISGEAVRADSQGPCCHEQLLQARTRAGLDNSEADATSVE